MPALTDTTPGAMCLLLASLQPASSGTILKPDEQVVLYPTLGWRVKGGWQVELHGRVFESEKRPVLASVLQHALGIDEKELSADEQFAFDSRATLLFAENERGKKINVSFRDQSYKLPKSLRDKWTVFKDPAELAALDLDH